MIGRPWNKTKLYCLKSSDIIAIPGIGRFRICNATNKCTWKLELSRSIMRNFLNLEAIKKYMSFKC